MLKITKEEFINEYRSQLEWSYEHEHGLKCAIAALELALKGDLSEPNRRSKEKRLKELKRRLANYGSYAI